MRTLGAYADQPGWDFGEGFIVGNDPNSSPCPFIGNKATLPTEALTADGVDESQIYEFPNVPVGVPRRESLFTPPMLMIKRNENLQHQLWTSHYLTYKDSIVGISAPVGDVEKLKIIDRWLSKEMVALKAYCAATSIVNLTRRATALACLDIKSLPFPDNGDLNLNSAETILASEIVTYQRDLVRLGDKSAALLESGHSAIPAFNETFLSQINSFYSENPLIAHPHQSWPGIICQPFSFGPSEIDWSDSDGLIEKLNCLLKEQQSANLAITRIARIYDDNLLFLIKPDRLRFWLRSIALRDADEVLADLRAQGY